MSSHQDRPSVPLEGKLSSTKIEALKKNQRGLDALDEWALFASHDLIGDLKSLAKTVNKLYPLSKKLTLYRGFNLRGVQDNMGVMPTSKLSVGDTFSYGSDSKALSFTTDISIARAFGRVVVKVEVDTSVNEVLRLTDELVSIIHERRNLKEVMTQKEVILLPTFNLLFEVVYLDAKKPGWVDWILNR